jgi:hypothetical protein
MHMAMTVIGGMPNALRAALAASLASVVLLPAAAHAGNSLGFDELRFGASVSIQGTRSHEDGVFPEMTLLFDPFGARNAKDWTEQLAHPRIALGTSVSTTGQANQLFGGLDWKVSFTDNAFFEAGFGGVVHDGKTNHNDNGPILGCSPLFHEYVGIGYDVSAHWDVIGQVAHSSHAGLCGADNDGMTRAGLQVGYKF